MDRRPQTGSQFVTGNIFGFLTPSVIVVKTRECVPDIGIFGVGNLDEFMNEKHPKTQLRPSRHENISALHSLWRMEKRLLVFVPIFTNASNEHKGTCLVFPEMTGTKEETHPPSPVHQAMNCGVHPYKLDKPHQHSHTHTRTQTKTTTMFLLRHNTRIKRHVGTSTVDLLPVLIPVLLMGCPTDSFKSSASSSSWPSYAPMLFSTQHKPLMRPSTMPTTMMQSTNQTQASALQSTTQTSRISTPEQTPDTK